MLWYVIKDPVYNYKTSAVSSLSTGGLLGFYVTGGEVSPLEQIVFHSRNSILSFEWEFYVFNELTNLTN